MRNWAIALFSLATLVACNQHPSPQELARKFTRNPNAYEQLRELIRADTGTSDCFEVGLDKIGDFWKHGDSWTRQLGPKQFQLHEVLAISGISADRYEQYKVMLASAGAERFSYCRSELYGDHFSALVYRSGLMVSGCSGTIDWDKVLPASRGKQGEDFTEIISLEDGWYLEYSCT